MYKKIIIITFFFLTSCYEASDAKISIEEYYLVDLISEGKAYDMPHAILNPKVRFVGKISIKNNDIEGSFISKDSEASFLQYIEIAKTEGLYSSSFSVKPDIIYGSNEFIPMLKKKLLTEIYRPILPELGEKILSFNTKKQIDPQQLLDAIILKESEYFLLNSKDTDSMKFYIPIASQTKRVSIKTGEIIKSFPQP